MERLPFLALLVVFQVVVYYLRRLKDLGQLSRRLFVFIWTLFFSMVFFVGATGLNDFSCESLVVWGLLTLFQLVVGYLLAPILGVQ